jgi:hypothetical protein
MTLTSKLPLLESKGAYARPGAVTKRWGQIIRESPSVAALLLRLEESGDLVALSSLGRIHSGVVTRANAYFIVRELPFDQTPRRFGLTRRDAKRVAVVMDGLETPHRIEREFLKELIKGPEALLSPLVVERSDQRLFDVTIDKGRLRERGMTGAMDYLRRGETVAYNVSDDTLKGGIPAQRSQIKNRKPFWYSLNVPKITGPRIALPEHFDSRYLATILPARDDTVVIDTLYTFTPTESDTVELIWASLNSLLTWYQIELRGRTQHGQGVLKVKIPDYGGILVANPARLSRPRARALLSAFGEISSEPLTDSLEVVSSINRIAFDEMYLQAIRWQNPAAGRLLLERELRAAIGERQERKASVAEAKLDRRHAIDVTASIDAYASRLAAGVDPFPDPRRFASRTCGVHAVAIASPFEGRLTIGTELFNQGEVFAGGVRIAQTPNMLSAEYTRVVLLHDPGMTHVDVPVEPELSRVMALWQSAVVEWQARFEQAAEGLTLTITDSRVQRAIRQRALLLLHAE